MKLKPCRNLDYDESRYPRCKLISLGGFPGVKYWDRFQGGFVTQAELDRDPDTPTQVQFCKLRGRINSMFSCYTPGEQTCYEEEKDNVNERE